MILSASLDCRQLGCLGGFKGQSAAAATVVFGSSPIAAAATHAAAPRAARGGDGLSGSVTGTVTLPEGAAARRRRRLPQVGARHVKGAAGATAPAQGPCTTSILGPCAFRRQVRSGAPLATAPANPN